MIRPDSPSHRRNPISFPHADSRLRSRLRLRKLRPLGLALVLGAAGFARASASDRDEVSREVHKVLPWKAGQRLDIEHSNGNIRLRGQTAPEFRIDVRIRVSASDAQEAKKFSDAIGIDIQPTAEGVSIRTRYPESHGSLFSSRQVSYAVDYDVVVPEAAGVLVRNRFGDVSAQGLKGGMEIHNGNGRLSVRDGRGPARLENSFGTVELTGNAGDVDVSNQNGTVQIADVDGVVVSRNRFGRVTVARVKKLEFSGSNADVSVSTSGPASVTTSFGAVQASGITGDLRIQNGNGPITATGVSGQADLATSFGPIRFEDVKKSVRCNGTNASVSGHKAGESATVHNTFGAVELIDVAGPVDVENSNGRVILREIRGKADVRNRFGEVEATGIAGDAAVTNQNASVTLQNVEGAVSVHNAFGGVSVSRAARGVKVESGNGAVSVSESGGPVSVRTSFALVEASKIAGDLTVNSQNGGVRVNDIKGMANVRTSFGPVTLEGVGGAIDVDNQNGSVEVREISAAKGCSRISVKTTFAPMRISLPETGGYTVHARTSFGKISSELPVAVSGNLTADSLEGRVGDGRCEVVLTNGNGNIDLVKQARR